MDILKRLSNLERHAFWFSLDNNAMNHIVCNIKLGVNFGNAVGLCRLRKVHARTD